MEEQKGKWHFSLLVTFYRGNILLKYKHFIIAFYQARVVSTRALRFS